ncbi:unnamed protein product [Polarella glacialis]|uniref:Uncharacterized protein n=2 Tax=Polarella glacialis TaxID=89957 RepID=A0A813HGU0_POLGL|nr:unnamed protein product [Polarella glacialis]
MLVFGCCCLSLHILVSDACWCCCLCSCPYNQLGEDWGASQWARTQVPDRNCAVDLWESSLMQGSLSGILLFRKQGSTTTQQHNNNNKINNNNNNSKNQKNKNPEQQEQEQEQEQQHNTTQNNTTQQQQYSRTRHGNQRILKRLLSFNSCA